LNEHPLLHQLSRFGIHLGLDRMRGFLEGLGSPHLKFPAVHIGGTNGKFSVTRLVASALQQEGYRVGVTISPHLQQVNERMSIDGQDISDAALDALLQEVDVARRAWAREQGDLPEDRVLTYFEVVTAAAFLWFAQEKVDVAVVEVGLGGRLDATNVLDGVVSAIVSVGIDHTEKLGPDLASIAAEKAGIFKPGRPAVVGPLHPSAMRVVRAIAGERGTPLIELYIVYNELAKILKGKGISIARNLVGSYITSLEMAGCSITLVKLDDELTKLWDAPVLTPALRWGA